MVRSASGSIDKWPEGRMRAARGAGRSLDMSWVSARDRAPEVQLLDD